nr:hypothetical protein [Gemmatimonadaceae bacterium]
MTGPVIPPVAWSAILPSLKTGDLLAFEGVDPLDLAIQFVEQQPYTHVGMVLRPTPDEIWFWDAPGGGLLFPDPVSGSQAQDGARVADITTIVPYYMTPSNPQGTGGGEIVMWVRQLTTPLSQAQTDALMTYVRLADGTPFPKAKLPVNDRWNLGFGFAESWMLGREFNATVAGTLFCAQLVAQSYMAAGLLPLHPKPANAYDPAMLMSQDPAVLPLIGNGLTMPVQVTVP